jgi:NAD-dependent SIR2 family protein deacetylase
MSTIRSMGRGLMFGLTDAHTLEGGKTESKMATANIDNLMGRYERAPGPKVNAHTGSMKSAKSKTCPCSRRRRWGRRRCHPGRILTLTIQGSEIEVRT